MDGFEIDFGLISVAYYFYRMLFTTLLGYLSNTKLCVPFLAMVSYIRAFGYIRYAIAPARTILYILQIIVGIDSDASSVARAHIAKSASLSSLSIYPTSAHAITLSQAFSDTKPQ